MSGQPSVGHDPRPELGHRLFAMARDAPRQDRALLSGGSTSIESKSASPIPSTRRVILQAVNRARAADQGPGCRLLPIRRRIRSFVLGVLPFCIGPSRAPLFTGFGYRRRLPPRPITVIDRISMARTNLGSSACWDDRSSNMVVLLLVSLLASGCTSASEATAPGGGQSTATSQATEPSADHAVTLD